MAITTEIDLTLESDFASQYDKRLKPDRVRRREGYDFFATPLPSIILRARGDSFFYDDSKYQLLDYELNFHYELFGMSPQYLMKWNQYDPYAAYFFGAGIFCDCCGVELNIMNTGNYMCIKCEKRRDKNMELS